MTSVVHKILPKHTADSVSPKGSRLAYLYCLPKTHKSILSMRPILSATGTYNNIPVDEAIQNLADKAFSNNVFNSTYDLQLKKEDLVELLNVSVKNQFYQFDGDLYEQIDSVAMGP